MDLRLTVVRGTDEDAEDAAPWQVSLWEELGELDEANLIHAPDAAPEDAKGAGEFAGLVARVPATGIAVIAQFLQTWVVRTGRTVEASIAGDSIKITGASREQQNRVIEVWLAHHASGT